MAPGCQMLPLSFQLPSHLDLKSPSPTVPRLLALVTSPASCSIQFSAPSDPLFPQGTVERALSPLGSSGIYWPGPSEVAWSRKTLKTRGEPVDRRGPQSAREEEGLAGLLLQKAFLSPSRLLGGAD